MSEQAVDTALTRAATSTMNPLELQRWRTALDDRTLDTCGCKASAKATAVTFVLTSAVGLLAFGANWRTAVFVVSLTVLAAIAGKTAGAIAADRQRTRLLSILDHRTNELGAN